MRVYIACNLGRRDLACEIRDALHGEGYHVTSTWHDDPGASIAGESRLPAGAAALIRKRCFREVASSDVLVLVACPGERHGAHVEAGFAIGRGIPIIVYPAGGVVSLLCRGQLEASNAREVLDVLATLETWP